MATPLLLDNDTRTMYLDDGSIVRVFCVVVKSSGIELQNYVDGKRNILDTSWKITTPNLMPPRFAKLEDDRDYQLYKVLQRYSSDRRVITSSVVLRNSDDSSINKDLTLAVVADELGLGDSATRMLRKMTDNDRFTVYDKRRRYIVYSTEADAAPEYIDSRILPAYYIKNGEAYAIPQTPALSSLGSWRSSLVHLSAEAYIALRVGLKLMRNMPAQEDFLILENRVYKYKANGRYSENSLDPKYGSLVYGTVQWSLFEESNEDFRLLIPPIVSGIADIRNQDNLLSVITSPVPQKYTSAAALLDKVDETMKDLIDNALNELEEEQQHEEACVEQDVTEKPAQPCVEVIPEQLDISVNDSLLGEYLEGKTMFHITDTLQDRNTKPSVMYDQDVYVLVPTDFKDATKEIQTKWLIAKLQEIHANPYDIAQLIWDMFQ